jgi:hypothetical protein
MTVAGLQLLSRTGLGSRADWVGRSVPLLKGAFAAGVFLCASLVPNYRFPFQLFSYATPFLFLVLLPESDEGASTLSFYRIAWCLIAVFQPLQSYAVAGSEAILATYPMIVVAPCASATFSHSSGRLCVACRLIGACGALREPLFC